MGMFDFLTGDSAPGPGGIVPTGGPVAPTAPQGKLAQMFSDPNFLQMLAQAGGNISQGKSFGEAVAGPATQFSQNRALQGTVAKRSQQQAKLMQGVIDALSGDKQGGISDFVGPKDDINSADSVTVSDDGISVKLPKRPDAATSTPRTSLTDEPLEAFKGSSKQALPFF
jgi:hypothetical protein